MRIGALLDLAVLAHGHLQHQAAEMLNLSETAVSHYGLGIRFPRNPASLVPPLVPYILDLFQGNAPPHAEEGLTIVLRDFVCPGETYLRALLENEFVAVGLARAAAQILAELAPQPMTALTPAEACDLLLSLLPLKPPTTIDEFRKRTRLFARYLSHRVAAREGYYLDLFGSTMRRIPVTDTSPLPKVSLEIAETIVLPLSADADDAPAALDMLREVGIDALAVPMLKPAATLDVLSFLVDRITIDVEFSPHRRRPQPTVFAKVHPEHVTSVTCLRRGTFWLPEFRICFRTGTFPAYSEADAEGFRSDRSAPPT